MRDQYTDPETGVIYLRTRYYDPATAQFLTRDPLDASTRSAYAYAQGNPLNRIDPNGLCAQLAPGMLGPFIPCGQYLHNVTVNSQGLASTINELYRPGVSIGDGGSADLLRHEAAQSGFDQAASHYTKVSERISNLKNLIRGGLDENDQAIAENILEDLQSAKAYADQAISAAQLAQAAIAATSRAPSLLEQVAQDAEVSLAILKG